MEIFKNFISLRDYCRQNPWPRLAQWHHWIYSRNSIALKCVKRIGGRYMLDLHALQTYISCATLEEKK